MLSHLNQIQKLGSLFFLLWAKMKNWGQAYGGIIVKPLSWLSIKLGAGLEVNSNPYRFNITMLVMKNRFYFIQIYEYGGSGFWYHIVANYEVCDRNYLGVIAKRYYGLGIDYEYKLKNIPLKFGFSPLYDFEDDNFKFFVIFIGACSYSVHSNSYPHLKTIVILPFTNNTTEYNLEEDLLNELSNLFHQ